MKEDNMKFVQVTREIKLPRQELTSKVNGLTDIWLILLIIQLVQRKKISIQQVHDRI
jgi:hypothetical protein